MKIMRNTSQQLVLESTPWILAIVASVFMLAFVAAGLRMVFAGNMTGLFISLFGGGLGVACLVIYVERLQVILDRDSETVHVRRRTLTNHEEDRLHLGDLLGAVVESSYSKSGGTTWRPVLMLRGLAGPVPCPITEIFTGDDMARLAADAINDWLGIERSDISGLTG
ncbi:hypothetical protein [Aliiruegeria sabulilitoris]|uniref:hypothetical protein n=1 Tax=Aliiruegeria sabulilitoris TaxID=1510458 RepID=UPI00082D9154|nr:hypothetical protein [Aliiruegeria sabulilitoris]NDR57343.1 hypothetical protein [Pseudoruegeria sp. M32A2M]